MKQFLVLMMVMAFNVNPAIAQDEGFLPSAAPQMPPARPGSSRPEVLDFEGDVIEGQKKAPELFLQLDVEKADLSSVLYDRRDFNDFHTVDSKRRPKFSEPKAVK
jgi:hypothetical protein